MKHPRHRQALPESMVSALTPQWNCKGRAGTGGEEELSDPLFQRNPFSVASSEHISRREERPL